MRAPRLAILVAVAALVAFPAPAQAPDAVAPKHVQLSRSFVFTDGAVRLYVVPAGKRLVITDVIVAAVGGPLCASISGGATVAMTACALAGTTFTHVFSEGLVFGPGVFVSVASRPIISPTGGECFVTMTGYLLPKNDP